MAYLKVRSILNYFPDRVPQALSLNGKKITSKTPFLLGVYCLYRHFVTDYLLTSVRKFGDNILQALIFVIPGEKWTKELKASGGKTWLVESYVHFMKREGAKNVLQYGI